MFRSWRTDIFGTLYSQSLGTPGTLPEKDIEVDGGVGTKNIDMCADAGNFDLPSGSLVNLDSACWCNSQEAMSLLQGQPFSAPPTRRKSSPLSNYLSIMHRQR